MLQKSLARSLRPPTFLPPSTTKCHACICRCGASITLCNPAQSRRYAYPAPSSRPSAKRSRLDQIRRRERDVRGLNATIHQKWCQGFDSIHKEGLLPIDGYDALSFVQQVVALSPDRSVADPVKVKDLIARYDGLSLHRHCWLICEILSNIGSKAMRIDPDASNTVNKFYLAMSRAGLPLATITMMAEALERRKRDPMTLRRSDIQYARAHLSQLAAQGYDPGAMVLEGKILHVLGNEERALELWTRAMEMILQEPARTFDARDIGHMYHISSPWIELMVLHYQRVQRGLNEYEQCQRAMDIGCEADDPLAHYYKALFTKRLADDGSHVASSEWLWHMTKAATSGYQKAIHDLAQFYYESGWKYIEDEPPDHVKPTPFDSYPPDKILPSVTNSPNRWLQFLGLKKPSPPNARDSLFWTATFPTKARDRFQLALQWLEINHKSYYAPSYLLHAKICLQPTLWSQADAPKSALELTPDRYTYASKQDYEAGNPISKPPHDWGEDPPNPFYNQDKAKASLCEVFLAYEAHRMLAQLRAKNAKMEKDALAESFVNMKSYRSQYRKWFQQPTVREMYEEDMEDLYVEAKAICDEKGWDLYDDDGGLVYKAGFQKKGVRKT